MAPRLPFDRAFALPGDVLAALRILPVIAEHTEAMEAHTALLRDMTASIAAVGEDTSALPALREEMAQISSVAQTLDTMDGRMANIEGSMPILVEVQRDLARLPETVGRLDERIEALSALMERMLASLDTLSGSVEALQDAVGPMGRLASRLPGQGRGSRE